RWGGVLASSLEATRMPGPFRWNLDAPADSAVAIVRVGVGQGRLHAFAAASATRGVGQDADTPEFELREAAIDMAGQGGRDRATVALFDHQPGRASLRPPLA